MTVSEELQLLEIEGDFVKLPKTQLVHYEKIRKMLLNAGGDYKRGSKFHFKEDPQMILDSLINGDVVNFKQENQFFYTPAETAKRMWRLLLVEPGNRILEPSAGQGHMLDVFNYFDHHIYAIEKNKINFNVLKKKHPDINLKNADFLETFFPQKFDRIIANPPFSKKQYVDHFYTMWMNLGVNGRIVAIAPKSWSFAEDKRQKDFRNWVKELNGDVFELDEGAFRESGTNVRADIICLNKMHDDAKPTP